MRWKFLTLMVILMVLMNSMSLKCIWKTCENKNWLGSYTTTIQSHGHYLRWMIIDLSTFLKTRLCNCIICHSDTIIPKILAMHTRCNKGLIAYHKSNDITTMRKHIEFEYSTLLKKLVRRCNKCCSKISTQSWA